MVSADENQLGKPKLPTCELQIIVMLDGIKTFPSDCVLKWTACADVTIHC